MPSGIELKDTQMLTFSSKIAPYSDGYDDGDESEVGGASRKRKRVAEERIG